MSVLPKITYGNVALIFLPHFHGYNKNEIFADYWDHGFGIHKLGTGCKDTLVICNSIFFIFLNQIKAQRDQKIMVWVEYFPYKYSSKVISND
jgi:hypothetical protein